MNSVIVGMYLRIMCDLTQPCGFLDPGGVCYRGLSCVNGLHPSGGGGGGGK